MKRKSYRDGVRTNIVDSMKSLIGATEKLNIPFTDEETKKRAEKILKNKQHGRLYIRNWRRFEKVMAT